MRHLTELPFDQYQRYRLVADLISTLPKSKGRTILDVGGRTELLPKFLPEHAIQLVDVDPSEAAGLVLGSGAALPFADGSFDIVCAFDTLEHVPPKLRDDFVRECCRVSKAYVMLAGPYADPAVDQAEEILAKFLSDKLKTPHRYLAEHRELGLPDRERVLELYRESGAQTATIGHGRLDRWLLAMCLELYLESDPLLQPLGHDFYAFYNRHVYPRDHGESVYRHLLVAAMGDEPIPDHTKLLGKPELTPDMEDRLQAFAAQAMQLDHEQTIWRPELKRLEQVVRSLEKDLSEHKQTLRTTETDLVEHRESLATSAADLDEHRRALESATKELAEHKESLGAVTGDLAEHKKVLATRTSEIEELRSAYETLEESYREQALAVEASQKEWAREKKALSDYQSELEGKVQGNDGLEVIVEEGKRKRESLEMELDQRTQALHQTQDQLREVQGQMDTVQSLASELNATLVQRNADIAEQQAEWTGEREARAREMAELKAHIANMEKVLASRKALLKRVWKPSR